MSAMAFVAFAGSFKLSVTEQNQISEEAEDWIDNMPMGLQDRLSDAVGHAMREFYSEINSFRNFKDTTGWNDYPVEVTELMGGRNGNIPMRFYQASIKKEQPQLPLLIYFHGGGWSLGSLNTTEKFCRALAACGDVNVISIDYPLSPEHPYPTAINTCVDAVTYIHSNILNWNTSEDLISLGGDGSGGNLALTTYESLPENIKIKSIVAYYPLLKTAGELNPELRRKYGRGYGFDSRLWESFIEAYKGKELTISNPLPPTLLIATDRDIITDEIMEFVNQNNGISYVEFTGALHGFISDGQQKTAFEKAVEFTNKFLGD